jgi:hypothetical protein
VELILVGFSPPERLAAIARHLRWPGAVYADPPRALYERLAVKRAPLWRVYTAGTLAVYLRAGKHPVRAVEDPRQLGADAILVDRVVRQIWRPRTPADRPPAAEVVSAAQAWLARQAAR